MAEDTNKSKSLLEKVAPYVLLAGLIFLSYYIFSKYQVDSTNKIPVVVSSGTPQIQVNVDTDFLTSEAFTKLKYIPDSSIFNEVTGNIPSGREDPFAPVK
jgi:hypothetical protein